MGELVPFPTKGRAAHAARPCPISGAPITVTDVVEIFDETLPGGQAQTGIVENIVITPNGVRLWVRRQGGPRGGSTRIVDAGAARLAPNPFFNLG